MLETRKEAVSNVPEKAVSGAPSPVRKVKYTELPNEGHRQGAPTQSGVGERKPLGLVWIDSPYPVVAAGLARSLEGQAWVHLGPEIPAQIPSSAIFDTDGVISLSENVRRLREVNPDIAILVFSLQIDLPLAKAALQAGVRVYSCAYATGANRPCS